MNRIHYIFLGTLICAMSSCVSKFPELDNENSGFGPASSTISAAVLIENETKQDVPYTKSMVDRFTTRQLQAQFLRIDEDIEASTEAPGKGTYRHSGNIPENVNVYYPDAYFVNGTVVAAPDNSEYNLRDVYFDPEQSYRVKLKVNDDPNATHKYDTLQFYSTRMIGWYPRTYKEFKAGTVMQLSALESNDIYSLNESTGRVSIKFKGLSLEDDLMVSDLKEAQQWHSNKGGTYSTPFGYNTANPPYCNYFTFHHYRSAIRVFAQADQSQQNLAMWGSITNVAIANQPTDVSIMLPDNKDEFTDPSGTGVVWSNPKTQSIITTAMFGDDPNHADMNQTVDFSKIDLNGATSMSRIYLGYAMVQPNNDVTVELHTTSGVYSVTIPVLHTYKDANGDTKTVNLFEPSKYYTINLNLQTFGAIAEILEFQSSEHYYDLTSLSTLDDDTELKGYRYANSYVVDHNSNEVQQGLKDLNARLAADNMPPITKFDGYAFCAVRAGNDQAGVISSHFYPQSAILEPYSVRLLWESERGLITNVQLVHAYIRFKVPDQAKKGNALIGAYDKNGKLIWSWHVWITDTPQEVTIGKYTFLDRNIGATRSTANNANSALETYGLYYQWGRKDPTMGPSAYNYGISCLNTAHFFDYAADEHTATEVKTFPSPTLQNSVEYPQYLILPNGTLTGYSFNWMGESYTDLWGYNTNDQSIHKSIYDPCPYGYRVPKDELENALKASTRSTSQYGHTYTNNGKSLFLPYTGYKGDDKNSNTVTCAWGLYGSGADTPTLGALGDYQTAMTSTEENSRYHRGRIFISKNQTWQTMIGSSTNNYSNYVSYDYTNRRTAAVVRCVKDEAYGGITATLTATSAGNHTTLTAGDVITLNYKASSTNSVLNYLGINLVFYSTDGEKHTSSVMTIPASDLGITASGEIRYTIQDQDFINGVSGGYMFVLTARNAAGRSAVDQKIFNKQGQTFISVTPDVLSMKVGETKTLSVSASPNGSATFSSGDTSIATVTNRGEVHAIASGTTSISVTVSGTSVTVPVNIAKADAALAVNYNKQDAYVSENKTLVFTSVSNGDLNYTYDNTAFEIVSTNKSNDGKTTTVVVKPLKTGVHTFKATLQSTTQYNGGATAECEFTVRKPQAPLTLRVTDGNNEITDAAIGSYITLEAETVNGLEIKFGFDETKFELKGNWGNKIQLIAKATGPAQFSAHIAETTNYAATTVTKDFNVYSGYLRFPEQWNNRSKDYIVKGSQYLATDFYVDAYYEGGDPEQITLTIGNGTILYPTKTYENIVYDGVTYTRYKVTTDPSLNVGSYKEDAKMIIGGNYVIASASQDVEVKQFTPSITIEAPDQSYVKSALDIYAYVNCEGLFENEYPEVKISITNADELTAQKQGINTEGNMVYKASWTPVQTGSYNVQGKIYSSYLGAADSEKKTINVIKKKRTITLSDFDLEVNGFDNTNGNVTSGANTTIAPGKVTIANLLSGDTDGTMTYTFSDNGTTYSNSSTKVELNNGVINAKSNGEVYLKITIASNDEFEEGSATCKVSVYKYVQYTSNSISDGTYAIVSNGKLLGYNDNTNPTSNDYNAGNGITRNNAVKITSSKIFAYNEEKYAIIRSNNYPAVWSYNNSATYTFAKVNNKDTWTISTKPNKTTYYLYYGTNTNQWVLYTTNNSVTLYKRVCQ